MFGGKGHLHGSERESNLPQVTQQVVAKAVLGLFPEPGQCLFRGRIFFYKAEPGQAVPTVFHFNNTGTRYSQGHPGDGAGTAVAISRAVSLSLYPNLGQ